MREYESRGCRNPQCPITHAATPRNTQPLTRPVLECNATLLETSKATRGLRAKRPYTKNPWPAERWRDVRRHLCMQTSVATEELRVANKIQYRRERDKADVPKFLVLRKKGGSTFAGDSMREWFRGRLGDDSSACIARSWLLASDAFLLRDNGRDNAEGG